MVARRRLMYCRTNWSWVESQSQREEERERFAELAEERAVTTSRLLHRERELHQQPLEEPAPDYPPASPSPSPTPPPENKKKIYQRTRFAADIPPARNKTAQSTQTPPPHKTSLGESFRKFVGKFRSASKEKRRAKKGSRSRSPSPASYQPYHAVDSHIAGGGGGSDGSGEGVGEGPVAPPRKQTQTMRRHGHGAVTRYYLGEDPFGSMYGREREYDGVTPLRRKSRRGSAHDTAEDERNLRNQQMNGNGSSTLGRFSKSTSRLISDRTNNHVVNHSIDYSDRGGVQTLPRKLRDDNKAKKQVYVTKSNVERVASSPHSWESQRYSTAAQPGSNSMINVSIVNKTALGPAKPARTYRTNLLRSKSFNVHAADPGSDFNSIHKSNPQLHRLDESPPPLKSPGIVTSISRSTKDLSQAVDEEDYRPYSHNEHSFTKSTGHLNGYSSRTVHDTKKKIFMKNLQDRAPELFRTLHGNEGDENRKLSPEIDDRPGRMFTSTPLKNGNRMEYSSSFRSSNTSSPLANGSDRVHSPTSPTYTTSITHTPSFNRSVVRRGSNDDYSETVRFTSKSDDPLRPSVTDTVQSFSKKTVPVRGGRGKETIESSETKTITKSQYRAGDRYLESKYGPRNGGVVIEVRNNPK